MLKAILELADFLSGKLPAAPLRESVVNLESTWEATRAQLQGMASIQPLPAWSDTMDAAQESKWQETLVAIGRLACAQQELCDEKHYEMALALADHVIESIGQEVGHGHPKIIEACYVPLYLTGLGVRSPELFGRGLAA